MSNPVRIETVVDTLTFNTKTRHWTRSSLAPFSKEDYCFKIYTSINVILPKCNYWNNETTDILRNFVDRFVDAKKQNKTDNAGIR
jgi:hypothetical protein